MKNTILIVITLLVLVYGVTEVSKMIKAKSDLQARVVHYLDFVDATSIEQVKRDLLADAGKYGVPLQAEEIYITYEDTEVQSVAQQIVGRIGAQHKNKRAVITLRYTARVGGIPVSQEISEFKIRHVETRLPAREEVQRLLE